MAESLKIDVRAHGPVEGGELVIFVGENLKPTPIVAKLIGQKAVDLIKSAAGIEHFKGKSRTALVLTAPAALAVDKLVVVGVAEEKNASIDWALTGGFVAGKINGKASTVIVDVPGADVSADAVADLALGARLRKYSFDRYKSKKDDKRDRTSRLTLVVSDLAASK